MSFVSDIVGKAGSIASGGADKAAERAADIQSQSADKAIELQRETRDIVRGDLQPFREAGQSQLSPLTSLISDPKAQLDFIQGNPFFKVLADDAQNRLFSNQAAKGKVGSGGTAKALQNSLLLLGQDLLNQNINQRQNLVNVGGNAAAGQASATQQSGNALSDLITGQGNVRAAGQIGAANARSEGIGNLFKVGTAVALSDRRFKRDIERIGTLSSGIPVYRYKFKYRPETHIGVIAQEVEKIIPEAVIERNNVKFVNYERLYGA